MISSALSYRALLQFGLLLGPLAACTHTVGSSPGNAEDAAQQSPAHGSTVTSEEIQRTPDEPIEKLLMGRVAGVHVTQSADGSVAVRIRGTASIRGSAEPLYVVDGIPIRPGANGSLTGITPYDIESIEVLKDAAATAMYGVRGANGVIVIETKRPDR